MAGAPFGAHALRGWSTDQLGARTKVGAIGTCCRASEMSGILRRPVRVHLKHLHASHRERRMRLAQVRANRRNHPDHGQGRDRADGGAGREPKGGWTPCPRHHVGLLVAPRVIASVRGISTVAAASVSSSLVVTVPLLVPSTRPAFRRCAVSGEPPHVVAPQGFSPRLARPPVRQSSGWTAAIAIDCLSRLPYPRSNELLS